MVVGVGPHCFGPDILQGAEIQVCMVRENLKIAPSR
jgi:hypothetical protein